LSAWLSLPSLLALLPLGVPLLLELPGVVVLPVLVPLPLAVLALCLWPLGCLPFVVLPGHEKY